MADRRACPARAGPSCPGFRRRAGGCRGGRRQRQGVAGRRALTKPWFPHAEAGQACRSAGCGCCRRTSALLAMMCAHGAGQRGRRQVQRRPGRWPWRWRLCRTAERGDPRSSSAALVGLLIAAVAHGRRRSGLRGGWPRARWSGTRSSGGAQVDGRRRARRWPGSGAARGVQRKGVGAGVWAAHSMLSNGKHGWNSQ